MTKYPCSVVGLSTVRIPLSFQKYGMEQCQ
jgi:hypothetical protein